MCNYCGCRAIPVIAELTEQHEQIADVAGLLEPAIRNSDWTAAVCHLATLRALLAPHLTVEEAGLFPVLAALEEFADGIATLYDDHDDIDTALNAARPDWDIVLAGLAQLREHITREEYGLFPASHATLTADQWDRVHQLSNQIHAHPHPAAEPDHSGSAA